MDQRVTLVTGVSKGIGRVVAEEMTARGHHVVGMSRSRPGDWFKGAFAAVDFADAAATEQALARVVEEHRITGLVNNAGVSNAKRAEEERQKIAGAIPMQRIGTPEEVAAACAYFLSEEAAYTTGQVLYVCGGLSVGSAMA